MAKKPASSSASTPSKPSTTSSKPSTSSSSFKPSASSPKLSTANSPPPQSTSTSSSSKPTQSTLSSKSSPQQIALHIWNDYLQNTPSRTLLLDAFMAFLVLIGVIQFLYAVLFGNYPFNAFLSGFSAAVGQFVLTASLRMQTVEKLPGGASAEAKKAAAVKGKAKEMGKEGRGDHDGEEGRVSSERAFADFVFGSLILHGFCVNFIN